MKRYATTFRAIEAKTGELATWSGPIITELTQDRAQKWCDENKGYLTVIGEVATKIEYKEKGKPDDFFYTQNN